MKWYGSLLLFVGLVVGVRGEEVDPEEEEEDDGTEPPPVPGPPLVPMCELLTSNGRKCEEHTVKTSDGYILDLYRIPPAAADTPCVALLMHGFLSSSESFVLKKESIGYQISDKGCDVWIGNFRGNNHGRKHETLNPDADEKFWDLSFQEMGLSDAPSIIKYVKEKTKAEQIYYTGHSLGAAVYFTMLDKVPEMASSIKETILLAPFVINTKYQFMLKDGGQMATMFKDTMKRFEEEKLWEAFPRADVNTSGHQIFCNNMPEMAVAYCNMGFEMADPVVGKFMPAGTSRKNLLHISQTAENGRIRMYNYATDEENQKAYGTPTPPDIDFKKATPITHIYYAEADQLVGSEDIETLKSEVPNLKSHYFVTDENFNHLDFLFPMSEDSIPTYTEYSKKLLDIYK